MLVVLAIVALLVGLAVPALVGVIGGSKLTQAADLVQGRISEAAEIAATENRDVVLRFYRYEDPMIPGSEPEFRAVQLVGRLAPSDEETLQAGAAPEPEPISNVFRLPDGIIFSDRDTYSSILSEPRLKCPRSVQISKRGGRQGERTQAECYHVEFRPDGTTSLPVGRQFRDRVWFVTLVDENEVSGSTDGLSKNFITLAIDPFTGSVRRFQP